MRVPEPQLKAFEVWLRKYGRSASTANRYAACIRGAYKDSHDPTEKLIDEELSPKYLRLIKASLKAWSEFKGDHGLEEDLSKMRLPPARRLKQTVALTVPQWRAIRKEIDGAKYLRNEAVRAELGMMACRGFRVADILRLKKSEVEEAIRQGVLSYEGKGRKRLEFTVAPIWKPYLELLADHKFAWDRVEDLVCPKSKPSARRSSATRLIERTLTRCGKKAGIDKELYPHLLRHTYATRYYEACRDPAKLQKHMQWANITTAMGYVDAGDRKDLDAIASSLFAV